MKMMLKKITAAILLSATLLSAFVMAPITASATSAAYQSTVPTTPISIDGAAGTDEVWSSIDDSSALRFNVWQSDYGTEADTTVTEDATVAGTVKIANDGSYIYFYITPEGNYRNEISLRIVYGEDELYYNQRIWLNAPNKVCSHEGLYGITGNAFPVAKDSGQAIFEGRYEMPEALKTAVSQGDVNIKIALFLQTGRLADNTNTGGTNVDWNDGLALEGCRFYTDDTALNYGKTVTLKQAEPAQAPIFSSALTQSPVTIDGAAATDEVWSSIDTANVLKLDAWKAKAADASANATATNVPTVKIANDYEYLYIYLETDKFTKSNNDSGKRVWFTIDYGYSEGTDDLIHYQWYTDKERNAYDGSTAQYCVEFKEDTPFSGGVIEAKFAIPNAVRNELSGKDVEIKLSVYLQNAMQADMTAESGWEAGFTSSTGEFKGQSEETVGDRVLLKQAQPSASSLPINVSSVKTDTPITIDGKATSGEIWSGVSAVKMSTWVNDITMVNRIDNAEAAPSVKIANDGDFVYILYEASYMEKRSVSFQIGFNGANGIKGDEKNVLGEWVEIELWTDADRGSKNTSSGLNTLKWNSEDVYAANSDMKQHTAWHIYNPSDAKNGSVEIRIPIPESVKSQIASGDVEITFSARTITQRWADNVSSDVPWSSGFVLPAGYTLDGSNPAAIVTLKQAQPSEEIPAPDYGANNNATDSNSQSGSANNTNKDNDKNDSDKKETEDVTDTAQTPDADEGGKDSATAVIIAVIAVIAVIAAVGAVTAITVIKRKKKKISADAENNN